MKKVLSIIVSIIIIISVLTISFFLPIKTTEIATIRQNNVLPRLYFEGNVLDLKTKADEEKVIVKYESDKINFITYASIKLQGTSSLNYAKKNYTVKFYKDEMHEEKNKIDLGWGEQNKYCLKANWIDKTHARNIVTAKITSSIQKKYNLLANTPNYGEIDGYPVEIYLNNEYLGLYTMNIPKDTWMFEMDEDNPNHLVFSASGWSDTNLFKDETDNFEDWEVEVGEESDQALENINRLLNFVNNSSDEEFKNTFEQYLNLDSVLNYYSILQYAELADNIAKNMLISTYDGKIWYVTLYDLDTSWGTNWNGQETLEYDIIMDTNSSKLFSRVKDNFPNELADRYFELRKEYLNEENVMKEFYQFTNLISKKSYKKDADKWGQIPGRDIKQIEEFLKKRTPIIDEYFTNIYTVKQDVKIEYKKNKNTIIATVKSNRNDIIIEEDSYTFTENGEHIFFYDDYLGNHKYVIAKVTDIIKPKKTFK